MKKQYLTTLFFVLISTIYGISQQFMSVTPASQPLYNNMESLIRNHFTGSGVEIVNVEYDNDVRAIGYFTDGTAAVGLSRGLLLTSGYAEDAGKAGYTFANNSNIGSSTPPQLAAIATEVLKDVAYFRITFRPFSDSIRFRYVFASEEYPEYACSVFNDVFGFFLSGPNPNGGDYLDQNIALIPGTNLPVAINNLHPENPVKAPCPPLNAQFYHDNEGSNHQPVYDGFTDVFVAEASVVPCATYVMLIAIADVGDTKYDSGVFLEAKSLESDVEISSSLDVGEDLIPEIAIADTISFSFTEVPANLLPLQIKIAGTATNGIDFQAVDSITLVNSPGEIIRFVIQPIPDSLQEQLETVIFNVCGSAGNTCFSKTYTLFIADPDSLYSPSEEIFLQAGGTTVLSVTPTAISNKSWTFSNATPASISPTGVLVKSEILVNNPFDVLYDINMLQSVCLNINHIWDGEVKIYLIAPNGTFVELSTNNGGNGDHYTNTCFSPAATADIRGGFSNAPASSAPFTGTFQPEGLWTDILGTPISGAWNLGVLDDQSGLTGTLLDWTITFSTDKLGNFKYLWSTGDTTPSILVSTPGDYSVTVSNEVGSFSRMFVVKEGSVNTLTPGEADNIFHLFPNPSTDEVMVILDKAVNIHNLRVYDMNGTCVLTQYAGGSIEGAEGLPKGVYIIALECDEGIFVQKLLRR